MPKVLIITYYWPPGSGAGVQRWLKFSKYLPSYGWEPLILTIDPYYATYPALDPTLEKEIPPSLRIWKTKATDYFRLYRKDKSRIPSSGFAVGGEKGLTGKIIRFVRGNFFLPDPRRGWNRFAFRKACEIIEDNGINHVITTSPPHSSQLIGLKLRKKYQNLRWIADLRDPWTDIYYYNYFYPSAFSRKIDAMYESEVLKNADKLITVGKSLKGLFASKHPDIEQKTEVIFNGYDDDDFNGMNEPAPDIFTLSYIGTLSGSYPLGGLLKALSELQKRSLAFRLRFVGYVSVKQKNLISSAIDSSRLEFIEYTDHKSAIRYMAGSSVLILIIPDHSTSGSIITGKLFEYLASRRPVLCLCPIDGDAVEILRSCGHNSVFEWDDNAGITCFISGAMEHPGEIILQKPAGFSRKALTGRLTGILSSL
jgi:glycosyltransferase involved in cell wall biosynthesis